MILLCQEEQIMIIQEIKRIGRKEVDKNEQEANSGEWLEGHRFSSNPSDSYIKNWTDSLK